MEHISAKDFYQKSTFNFETQNQIWCSQIADAHDNFCNCNQPFAHLLASIFPPGHADRKLSIDKILLRDYKEKCLSGGNAEKDHGLEDGAIKKEEDTEEGFTNLALEEDVDALLAAAADAAEGTR